jgi:hypothetical protein
MHWIGGWADSLKKGKFGTLPGIELQSLYRPVATSITISRLNYPDDSVLFPGPDPSFLSTHSIKTYDLCFVPGRKVEVCSIEEWRLLECYTVWLL